MKKGTIPLLIISAIVLCLIIVVVKSYRSLSILKEEVVNKESDINVQLSRKKEQITNLIDNCKDYIKDDILLKEIEGLNKSLVNGDISNKSDINKELSKKINELFEDKKEELLNNETITNTIKEILSTEKRIETAKNNYNQAVNDYNSKINSFPSSIIASFRGFKDRKLFVVNEEIMSIN